MDSLRLEKANAISRYRRIQRIATLFRFVEIFVFVIILSRCFTQFAFNFNFSAQFFRGISSTLISPKFIFVIGNLIVVSLLLISGRFSSDKIGEKTDLYDEYIEECRKINHQFVKSEEKKHAICPNEKIKMRRSHSTTLERAHVHDRRRKLRRSVTEKCRKSDRKVTSSDEGSRTYAEDEMSNEEFRRTVEAFIERQQRSLREEEEFSAAVVSFEN